MKQLDELLTPLRGIAETGGPVVVILMAVAVLTLAVALYKTWQFRAAAVGRHRALSEAVNAWERGDAAAARSALGRSKSYLAPVIELAMSTPDAGASRLQAEAELRFAKLERGFRLLDSVAQLAPLLGLFGTVLGMIEAFRALQDAGSQVDPSILAGGIWVALLTTAVGLAVVFFVGHEAAAVAERDGDRVILPTIDPKCAGIGKIEPISITAPLHAIGRC